MARDTHDREDLLLEGVNLPERARLRHEPSGREWVIGWRGGSGPAIYDGSDRVFQFNADNQLRRVYLEGTKLAAQGGGLCELNRSTSSAAGDGTEKVKLLWQPIDTLSQQKVLAGWKSTRQNLADSLQALQSPQPTNSTQIAEYSWIAVGETDEALLQRARSWLKSITDNPAIASQANA